MSKSLPFYKDNRLGNVKMKGKRTCILPCGCCITENKKKKIFENLSRTSEKNFKDH
jgi:hypothetical protein